MHFGASNSLLSRVDGTAIDAYRQNIAATDLLVPGDGDPSEVLTAFVRCLVDLLGELAEDQKRTLILNGDILELALAADNIAAMEFQKFLKLAFTDRTIFSDIVFIPGNHDHHLWETARENQYAEYVATTEGRLDDTWHATTMRAEGNPAKPYHHVEAALIRGIMRRQHLADVPLSVHYPTFGVLAGPDGTDQQHCAVFHHGHYTESIYLLMSRLQTAMFPGELPPKEIWQWEADNFAWVDFVWSTLGRSGTAGTDVGLVYDLLKEPGSRTQVQDALADTLIEMKAPRWIDRFEKPVINKLANLIIGAFSGMERIAPQLGEAADPPVPSPSLLDGVSRLLTGPVVDQVKSENSRRLPGRTTFIFGHTHKPYVGHMAEETTGFPDGVDVYNSGGWVVDEAAPDPRQGASMIVLDEQLNAASIDLYRQRLDGTDSPIGLSKVASETPNPLFDELSRVLTPEVLAAGPWSELVNAVATEVRERHGLIRQLIDIGAGQLRRPE
jgi:hypothetical protein